MRHDAIRYAIRCLLIVAAVFLAAAAPVGSLAAAADGVFVRFRLIEPRDGRYYVRLGGYIHKSPWYLPGAVIPAGADKDESKRAAAGEFTPWFDLAKHAGGLLHGQLSRAGGLAEFPNVTADFISEAESPRRRVVVELATAPDPRRVIKRFEESFEGSLTSFLVSPHLDDDAEKLETASQMTARRLAWAREASGGKAVTPKELIVQTSFWGPQRPELNLKEAEVLRLLGFNVVGNQRPEVVEAFDFRRPGHTHGVDISPRVTRQAADEQIGRAVERMRDEVPEGVPFGFSDEITCRGDVESPQAREHFAAWLKRKRVDPRQLGAANFGDVEPIETPDEFLKRAKKSEAAARRVFYYTSRFRQEATTERFGWLTESLHRKVGPGPLSSTLLADHPYFSGTGLGMGWTPNPCWGRIVLGADWFDLARRRAVDLAGIEDWMGLQYMYGPNTTWEGFQLMGFQAAMFRSASRGQQPIIAWITPSDEANLRLKAGSALCQGAKHFFFWTYGPTCTSTENYWSDLRGAYDGIVHVTRQLAAAEDLLAPGRPRKTRLALLYSISSDLWQPFGYLHMLERRGTYLSLVHDQYLVDMLTEEDVDAGRLRDYDVLYATDPCIKESAAKHVADWVRRGGSVYGSCAAGRFNEFGEEVPGLAEVFGIEPNLDVKVQPGRYHIRGALNGMDYLDRVTFTTEADNSDPASDAISPSPPRPLSPSSPSSAKEGAAPASLGVIGAKVTFRPTDAEVTGTFTDGSPAAAVHAYGEGRAVYFGCCPAVAYIKEARFVPAELKERWPAGIRRLTNAPAAERVPRLVELSHPVVEAGVYDAPEGTVLVLANFTYEPIEELEVRLDVAKPPRHVVSAEEGPLKFSSNPAPTSPGTAAYRHRVTFSLRLGLNDVVRVE